jgi:hypothetical protein
MQGADAKFAIILTRRYAYVRHSTPQRPTDQKYAFASLEFTQTYISFRIYFGDTQEFTAGQRPS